MNENILREILRQSVEREYAEFDNAPEHKFSIKHRIAMRFIFRRFDRNLQKSEVVEKEERNKEQSYSYLGFRGLKTRLIMVILIFLTIFLCGWMVVYFSRDFHGTVFSDNTHLSVVNSGNSPKTIEYKYALTNVPEEFKLAETTSTPFNVYTVYTNENGQTIALNQWVKKNYNPHLNTEYNNIEEIDINGHTALCIDFSNSSIIVWDNGDYVLHISADLTKKELADLAKSLNLQKA